MSERKAASGQHRGVGSGSTRRTLSAELFAAPDPKAYEEYVSPKMLVNTPRWVRSRIRATVVQVHGLINSRLLNATRPNDVATEAGMADEIRGMVAAIRFGEPEDVRAARVALAATLILLAERDDRPAKP